MESAPLLGKREWRPIAWCNGVPVRDVDGELRAMSDVQGRYACRVPRGYCLWGDPSKHMWTVLNCAAVGVRPPEAVIVPFDYETFRRLMEQLPEYGRSMPRTEGILATVMTVVQVANPRVNGVLTLDYGSAYTFADVPRCLPALTSGMVFTVEEFMARAAAEFWQQLGEADRFSWSSTDDADGEELRLALFGKAVLPELTEAAVYERAG